MPPVALPIRVFLIDDHPVFRRGIAAILESDPRFSVVGEADDAPTALAALRGLEVDAVVVDLALRRGSGLDVLQSIKAEHPAMEALVLSMHDEEVYAERALRAGARGYLMKDSPPDRVRDAVMRVAKGEVVTSERVNSLLVRRAIDGHRPARLIESLSNRELDVFGLIGRGLSTKEIAQHLHLSVKTIETHRANIKVKLELKDGADLVRAAILAASNAVTSVAREP
jgi:DNA-binding NarL/FixJ family response regulator